MSLFIIFICCCLITKGQQVHLLKMSQLNDRFNKGLDTTYIINFWATWCAPCIKELPYFEKLSQHFKKEKLKVLLVTVDFKSELSTSVIPFLRKNKFKSQVFMMDEYSEQEYIDKVDKNWSGALPATLFVKNSTRKFFEKEFTYQELLTEFQNMRSL